MKSAFFTKNASFKPINGDFGGVFQVNKATIGLLADGDSTQPCDWKAARVAVDGFLNSIRAFENIDTDDQVKNAVIAAQKCVAELHGICSGAATSFGAVVCLDNGRYWCVHFGHAAIFKFDRTALEQISTAVEMDEIALESGQLAPKEGFLLLSSGMLHHPTRPFLSDMLDWIQSEQPDQKTDTLLQLFALNQDEDISALVLKFDTNIP
jgi:hypothetical protein